MPAKRAPDEDVWWTGLRWVDAARMQIWRFEDAFYEEVHALDDARHRHQLNGDDSEVGRSWRDSYDEREPYDPGRPLRVPSWSLHMQVANELDLLGVAVRNVLRAQTRIPEERRPTIGGQDALELLRNVAEHWDEVGGRSASQLADDHPDIEVGGAAYTKHDIWIGGMDGVPLSRIEAWLIRVWVALVACLAEAGIAVPDDLNASRFAGDDDLPWPTERLHFHWSLLRVDEQDWPHEKMPQGLAEAWAVMFSRRRMRDNTD